MGNEHLASFTGRLWDEWLNVNQFLAIEDGKMKI